MPAIPRKIPVNVAALETILKTGGITKVQISLDSGYADTYLSKTLREGYITKPIMTVLQHKYSIQPEAYLPKVAEAVETDTKVKSNGSDHDGFIEAQLLTIGEMLTAIRDDIDNKDHNGLIAKGILDLIIQVKKNTEEIHALAVSLSKWNKAWENMAKYNHL